MLAGQFQCYDDLPTNLDELTAIAVVRNPDWLDPDGCIGWIDDVACFRAGKYRGRSLTAVFAENPSYFSWMLTGTFSPEVKESIRNFKRGVFPTRDRAAWRSLTTEGAR